LAISEGFGKLSPPGDGVCICFGIFFSGTIAGSMSQVGLGKNQGDPLYAAEGYFKIIDLELKTEPKGSR
jgi:hypothetical protein